MPQELVTILWGALGTLVTAFIGWLSTTAIIWLNNKIKDQKLARWSSAIARIIFDAVQTVQQTFVDEMKKTGKFDAEAAKQAKDKAMAIVKGQLTEELRKYITDNFGDMEEWLMNQIEAVVHQLKN